MIKKAKEEKTIDLLDFHIQQVENGWKVSAHDVKQHNGWFGYDGEDTYKPPKTYVFEDQHKLITWIEKNV